MDTHSTLVFRLPARQLAAGFALALTAIFLLHKPDYLLLNIFFWFGLATLPISMRINTKRQSSRLLLPALVTGLVALLLPTTIGTYLLLLLCAGYVTERHVGTLGWPAFVHALLLSPLYSYAQSVVSFPLRMQLSAWAGKLMQLAGLQITIQGNTVVWQQHEFLVDKACAGLHMLGYGLLFGTIMLARVTRCSNLSLPKTVGLYLLLVALILASNLIRIVVLIVLQAPPGHWLHEGVGLACFAAYVLLPFYLLLRYMAKRSSGPQQGIAKQHVIVYHKPRQRFIAKVVLLAILFSLACWRNVQRPVPQSLAAMPQAIDSYQRQPTNNGIGKYTKGKALLYIKPPVAPYHAEHSPLVCWQGSGYQFKAVYKKKVNGLEVNVAKLAKGNDSLVTAWWFDNGSTQTGHQFAWRWLAIRSQKDFAMVNLTCPTEQQLLTEMQQLIRISNE